MREEQSQFVIPIIVVLAAALVILTTSALFDEPLGRPSLLGKSTFDTNANITRAHAAMLLVRALNVPQASPTQPTFADVSSSHVAYSSVEGLYAKHKVGFCSIKTKLFCPEKPINKIQVAYYVGTVLGLAPNPTISFVDVSLSSGEIAQAVVDEGIMQPCSPTQFCPLQQLTRAQLIEILDAAALARFAPATDPFNEQEYLILTKTNDDLAISVVGASRYTWPTGYYLKDGAWQSFTFTGENIDGWIVGGASASIASTSSWGFVLAFVCTPYAGTFYCGPRATDTNASVRRWTIAPYGVTPTQVSCLDTSSHVCATLAPAHSTSVVGELCPAAVQNCYACDAGYAANQTLGTCVQQQVQCAHECTTSGATQCVGTQIQTCGNHDADMCLEWGESQTCQNPGESCVDGACVVPQPDCSDECSAEGVTNCTADNKITTCGNFDADSCLEWNTAVACQMGQECKSSATSCTAIPEICTDGIDNDADGFVDYDGAGVSAKGDADCPVSITATPTADAGIVEGLQLTVSCPISHVLRDGAVTARLGTSNCWFSKWEGLNAIFSCKAPDVGDSSTAEVRTAECTLNTSMVTPSDTNPRVKSVKVCGERSYYASATNSCKSTTACGSGTYATDYLRATGGGSSWGSKIEGPYGSIACCPSNYCAGGANDGEYRCYAPTATFRTREADGGWNYEDSAWHAWICGNYEPNPKGYIFNRCDSSRVGKTFEDTSGKQFCCTQSADTGGTYDAFRFMPGACPTGSS